MASAGQGSGRSAQHREAEDAGAVKSAGTERDSRRSRPGSSGAGGMDEQGAEGTGPPAAGGTGEVEGSGGDQAGSGPAQQSGAAGGGTGKGEEQQGTPAADIPEDIPADGSGEDQVARQLREAAMAEKDPVVREALWEQYRRHTGIRK